MIEVLRRCEPPVNPEPGLCACGHLVDAHDGVASRYCRATLSGCLSRGCICVAMPAPHPR
ncbi:MAG: RGCVC family protein [Mycobacteriales bacterium]